MKKLAAVASLVVLVAAVGSATAATKSVKVSPKTVDRGETLKITGAGWSGKVDILVGPANSEADRVKTVTADEDGRFSYNFRISRRAERGPYAALACQRDCRVKRTARFTIGEPAG